jgi:hypothetical protein
MLFRISAFLLTVCFLSACQKEAELKKQLEPAAQAARELQWMSSFSQIPMAECLRDFVNSRQNPGFLQVLPDGQVLFDYSKGILCADGLMRKGKCKVKNLFSKNALNDTAILTASESDSFGIQTQSGWVYFSGEIKVMAQEYYLLLIVGEGQFAKNGNSSQSKGELNIRLNPQGQTGRNSLFSHELGGMVQSGNTFFSFEKCAKNKGCYAFYSTGTGAIIDELGKQQIFFDAYGNGQCDQVIKVVEGRNELLFDTW